MEKPYKAYLFEYEFDGAMWAFEISAQSEEEAVRRVRALSSQALILGEKMFTVTIPFGFIARIICAVRNWFGWNK